ncbi:MAG: hypothetical protein GY772_29365 [bacterium]|nr:hypothetical protein [bacterium]
MALQPIEGQPGLFRDTASGQVVNIRDFRESDKYDTIRIPGEVIQPGTEFVFFQDIQGKREVDTNIKTPRKLSAGESMVLDRIGLYVRLAVGNQDVVPFGIKKIVENSFYRLKINDILQEEGPSIKFPSGYGLYGNTTENGTGIVSIGVPATASASRLVKKQMLNQNHELDGIMRFDARNWIPNYTNPDTELQGDILVTNYLHGLIRAAVTK